MTDLSFPKKEKLCGQVAVEKLFADGKATIKYPLRLIYTTSERKADVPLCRLMVSVSKRRFKHAVDRNRVKRLVREAYRLNKHVLLSALQCKEFEGLTLSMAYVFIGDKLPTYQTIEKSVLVTFAKLTEALGLATDSEPQNIG